MGFPQAGDGGEVFAFREIENFTGVVAECGDDKPMTGRITGEVVEAAMYSGQRDGAISAWVAMERFKVGVIPTLGACAVLGMMWKLM